VSLPDEYGKYNSFVNRHIKHFVSGASAGLLWSTIFAGPKKGIQGSVLFGVVGLAGSITYDRIEEWRREKGSKLRAEMQRENKETSAELSP